MSLYATPKIISDSDSCGFYHVIDIPGIGLRGGPWDLRTTVKEYLGNVSVTQPSLGADEVNHQQTRSRVARIYRW